MRDDGVIYVHIPKTAGSSLEHVLAGGHTFDSSAPPDYEHCWGWCPDRTVWMQHLSIDEMIKLDLLSSVEARDFFKFTVVRNPFDRLVSAHRFLNHHTDRYGSLGQLLSGGGPFEQLLVPGLPKYRGEHLRSQTSFITEQPGLVLDHVGRFENLYDTVDVLVSLGVLRDRLLPHLKRARRSSGHYSMYFTDSEKTDAMSLYSADCARFGYSFEDRRTALSRIRRTLEPARSRTRSLLKLGKTW